jgi:hypothetical protein
MRHLFPICSDSSSPFYPKRSAAICKQGQFTKRIGARPTDRLSYNRGTA